MPGSRQEAMKQSFDSLYHQKHLWLFFSQICCIKSLKSYPNNAHFIKSINISLFKLSHLEFESYPSQIPKIDNFKRILIFFGLIGNQK